ncbi:hypothetical protein MHUMG1_07294 [Metarhizium humberi]|uniref:Uncharacterized protein n=1 Tax=Metarhizium humberi TaxID=2596975 RepID=A0A9P8M7K5_9HYPO|nr:hypothetical protein MHUMG1_07294 [Metarhizium humberi]
MCETTPPVPTAHLETLLRDKRIASTPVTAPTEPVQQVDTRVRSRRMSLDYRLQRKPAVDGGETDAESLTMNILREEYYIDENLQILRDIMVPVLKR